MAEYIHLWIQKVFDVSNSNTNINNGIYYGDMKNDLSKLSNYNLSNLSTEDYEDPDIIDKFKTLFNGNNNTTPYGGIPVSNFQKSFVNYILFNVLPRLNNNPIKNELLYTTNKYLLYYNDQWKKERTGDSDNYEIFTPFYIKSTSHNYGYGSVYTKNGTITIHGTSDGSNNVPYLTYDDYNKIKYKNSSGISFKFKITAQVLIAFVGILLLSHFTQSAELTNLYFPFFKNLIINLGWFFIPFSIFIIVGS